MAKLWPQSSAIRPDLCTSTSRRKAIWANALRLTLAEFGHLDVLAEFGHLHVPVNNAGIANGWWNDDLRRS